jgi:hypothetical protein
MKAITTKYIGTTATKPSRISAYDIDGNRVVINYPVMDRKFSKHSEILYYEIAAKALCNKMGWSGELIGGAIKDGYVFVFRGAK